MHPILAAPRRMVLYLLLFLQACWVLVEILRPMSGAPRAAIFLVLAPLFLIHAFSCLASFYLCRAMPVGESRTELLASSILVSAGVTSAAMAGLGVAWSQTLADAGLISDTVADAYRASVVLVLVFAVFLYLLTVAVQYLFLALARSREAETRAYEARILAREAELQALRAQVDPHFLFNSLNSIAALVGSEPKRARKMCSHLAAFLRRTLRLGARERIPLDDELSLADDYLAVERIRFGERLEVRRQVDDGLGAIPLPPLVLQPLVENAVRHGIAQRVEGGEVLIAVRRAGRDRLLLEVENPCDADRRGRRGGMGLENVRRRLHAAWPDRARLTVDDAGDRFRVTLDVPIDTLADDSVDTDEEDRA